MNAETRTSSDDRTTAMAVPFVDLEPVTRPVQKAVLADVDELMARGAFVNGPAVERFEREFAVICERRHCVGVASGLDALRLGLAALGVGAGDEVIVPAMTFVATFEAVAQVGATPVPVDVRSDDVGLDAAAVEAVITDSTRAILPVHLYGQMADMRTLRQIAGRHDLILVEDAAQAHAGARDGLRAGGCSDAAAFSFYPSKNLGAMGDAGALVTDDEGIAARVRALRQHGETARYRSELVGYTSRLDAFQAVVLSRKLPFLDAWTRERRQVAAAYTEALEGVGDLVLPQQVPRAQHVWHLYTIRTETRDQLADHLGARGVSTGRHYPEPPHLSRAFAGLGYAAGSFPVAEAVARETLSLPIYPGLTTTRIEHVVHSVRNFFARG